MKYDVDLCIIEENDDASVRLLLLESSTVCSHL